MKKGYFAAISQDSGNLLIGKVVDDNTLLSNQALQYDGNWETVDIGDNEEFKGFAYKLENINDDEMDRFEEDLVYALTYISKAQYESLEGNKANKTAFLKKLKDKISVGKFREWEVAKIADIYVFGCGEVKLDRNQIKNFIKVAKSRVELEKLKAQIEDELYDLDTDVADALAGQRIDFDEENSDINEKDIKQAEQLIS